MNKLGKALSLTGCAALFSLGGCGNSSDGVDNFVNLYSRTEAACKSPTDLGKGTQECKRLAIMNDVREKCRSVDEITTDGHNTDFRLLAGKLEKNLMSQGIRARVICMAPVFGNNKPAVNYYP